MDGREPLALDGLQPPQEVELEHPPLDRMAIEAAFLEHVAEVPEVGTDVQQRATRQIQVRFDQPEATVIVNGGNVGEVGVGCRLIKLAAALRGCMSQELLAESVPASVPSRDTHRQAFNRDD